MGDHTISTLTGTVYALKAQIEEQRVQLERCAADLRARRITRAEVPRCVGDLIGWRERRQLTQAQAAKLLGVGRSTFERAEHEDLDTPLSRKLQRALLRYIEEMNTLPDAAPDAKRRRRSSACGF
jgi:DNA-binding XRE family transcriptional regulator